MRGIYWLKMPHYAELNHLMAKRLIPAFYWTGNTDMHCLARVIDQTRREALSHHIQRLMVTRNFALLAGIRPQDSNLWYMVVYADAYEWVELPDTHGIAIIADTTGSPTSAHCRFDVKKKEGENACPFNYLYWNFMLEHENSLKANQRLKVVGALERMSDER